jgi:hypothetical protein
MPNGVAISFIYPMLYSIAIVDGNGYEVIDQDLTLGEADALRGVYTSLNVPVAIFEQRFNVWRGLVRFVLKTVSKIKTFVLKSWKISMVNC